MTVTAHVAADAASARPTFAHGVEVVATLEELDRIKIPDVAGVISERLIPQPVLRWLDALDPALLPQTRDILAPRAVPDAVLQACREAGTPQGLELDTLINDIGQLAHRVADIMGTSFVRLRLNPVSHNACRKFHIDALPARLVCTYRGSGTQFGFSDNGEDPSDIVSVPTGAPFMLRGLEWPETPASGLRHRSPPIEGTGETRFVLVLDPMAESHEEV